LPRLKNNACIGNHCACINLINIRCLRTGLYERVAAAKARTHVDVTVC
jgi:hypothetical protein